MMFEHINRPMIPEDIEWVEKQMKYNDLKRLVREYSQLELPLFNGNLRNSNIDYIDDGFKLTHWYRMWEYLSVYHIAIKSLDKDKYILDCGGAGSLFPFWLAEQGRSVKVIDIQNFHTELSDLVARERGLDKLKFCCEDMRDIQDENDTYDFIYSVSVIEHVPPVDRKRVMKEIHRVLKPDGIFAVTFDFGDVRNINKDGCSDILVGTPNMLCTQCFET